MIKLLMGITLSETGGSQQVVYNLLANLPESLYQITLITAPGGELIDWVAALNRGRENRIRIIVLPCLKRNISPFDDLKAFASLLTLMKKEKFDVAHFHNSKMGIIGRASAFLTRVPGIYYTVHGWGLNPDTAGRLYPVMSLLERLVSGISTENIFVSRTDMQKGLSRKWALDTRSRLIYNGISEAKDAPPPGLPHIPAGMPVLVFVARLAEPKDPIFAIRTSERLLKEGCPHALLIVGDGPMYPDCRRLIGRLNLESHVLLLGKRGDVRSILKKADIFCLFSKWEGLPITILEAMSAGLPVVASDVGGVPELVAHGETGYLVKDFDVGEAAGYLLCLIESRALRLSMGEAARARVRGGFSLDGMVAQYRRLYERQPERRPESRLYGRRIFASRTVEECLQGGSAYRTKDDS